MQSLIGHHCGDEETMNIITLPEIRSNVINLKWLCRAVMTLGVDLLLNMTKIVTIMVTRRPCIPVVLDFSGMTHIYSCAHS